MLALTANDVWYPWCSEGLCSSSCCNHVFV